MVFEPGATVTGVTYLPLELDLLVVAVRHVPFGQPCLAPEDITCRSACVVDRAQDEREDGGEGVEFSDPRIRMLRLTGDFV